LNTNLVLGALERAKLDAQLAHWERKEAGLRAAIAQRLGVQPPIEEGAAAAKVLAIFRTWCDRNGIRHLPAQPASVAQFVLDHSSVGVMSLAEIVASISESHSSRGLSNPVATWMVAAAMERAGDIAPPRSWPKGLKEQFAQLPQILKKYVAEHDAQREKVLRRAQNDVADAKRALAALQATVRSEQTTAGAPDGQQGPQ
jgi:hypothetical protein